MLDTQKFYWRSSLAVVLAAATTTAVLTGALLVGDSVRGSLRQLTLERLGGVDFAVLSEPFVTADLGERLAADLGESLPSGEVQVAPAIVLQGAMRSPETGRRASAVGVQGIDERFFSVYDPEATEPPFSFERREGQAFPSVVINQTLAEELAVTNGDEVLLSLERPSDVPRETLMGDTDPSAMVRSIRFSVREVISDRGVGSFRLNPSGSARVAFAEERVLVRALDRRGLVNALLISAPGEAPNVAGDALRKALARQASESDLGLEILVRRSRAGNAQEDHVALRSREIILRPEVERRVLDLARERGWASMPVSTYLANRLWKISDRGVEVRPDFGDGRDEPDLIPYSTVSAIAPPLSPALGEWQLTDGSTPPELERDQILLNEWAAQNLDVSAGARVGLAYFEVGEREQLIERVRSFEVAGILSQSGLGADPELTPDYPGVSDVDDMSDWEPTFPVDLSLIRSVDEEYWDAYRGAPKAFVHPMTARAMWSSRFGELSEIRLAAEGGSSELDETLRRELPEIIPLAAAGLAVQDIKASSLDAARGATDFTGLFLGFSMFLIAAAALLVGLFFRLLVESRAAELGLRLAIGESIKGVRLRFLGEGALLGGLGVALGVALAVAYAATMIFALTTLWRGAVGATRLELFISPLSLFIGAIASFLVILFAVQRAVRRLAALPVPALLRGVTSDDAGEQRSTSRARWVAAVCLGLALLLLAASMTVASTAAPALFFGLGAALLGFGLAVVAMLLRPGRWGGVSSGFGRPSRLAFANAGLHPGRSLLSTALVASACFVIVSVGAYGLRFGEELRERSSGAGGFSLLAESDIAVHHDLGTPTGRFELGLPAGGESEEAFQSSTIVPFRVRSGDDVSCLNLYQPSEPRLLGAPRELIERGGFTFSGLDLESFGLESPPENPWSLLEQDLEGGRVPAFGDANSVRWILKSGLGKEVEFENARGETVRLRIVGLLRKSVFQSELVIAESQLLAHFPGIEGYSSFLIDAPVGSGAVITNTLEEGLDSFGMDVTTTAARLQAFQAVENTYLGTFQALGGLGLLLGTLGLAVILLRNVMERRRELALLRAVGFRGRRLATMVMAENGLVLIAGMVVGTLAALVAVWPHLLEQSASVPWLSLAMTLLAVLLVGSLASLAAVRRALSFELLPALRGD